MMLLNEVYNKGEFACNDENKKRLFEILHAFPQDEPTRKRFITETVGWSGRFGELERGDPEVQDQVGRVFANGTYDLSPLVVVVCREGRSSLGSGLDHLFSVHGNPLVDDGQRSDQDLGWLSRNTY